MEKIIKVHFKDGKVFVTNKNSYDALIWGVSALGHWGIQEEKVEVQIPWTSIDHVVKVIS